MEYKILRQNTCIFKVKAASEKEALEIANKVWDDDLRVSSNVIYSESMDNVIGEG